MQRIVSQQVYERLHRQVVSIVETATINPEQTANEVMQWLYDKGFIKFKKGICIPRCHSCGKLLEHPVWLEKSDNGKYYNVIPGNHKSDGFFPFDSICAKEHLQKTNIENTKTIL